MSLESALSRALRLASQPQGAGSFERDNPRTIKCRTLALSEIQAEPNATEIPLSGHWLLISHGSQASPRLEVAFDIDPIGAPYWIPAQKGTLIGPTDRKPFRKILVRRRTGTPSTADEVDFVVDTDPNGGSIVETPRSPAMTDAGLVQVDTELPDASALADNTANPTVPGVGAFLMEYDGATWDRTLAPTRGAGAVAAGTPRTTLASDDPAVVALQVMDDWDETDRAKVNPIVGQAGIAAGDGTSGANTTRTVRAQRTTYMVALASFAGPIGTFLELLGHTNLVRVLEVVIQPSATCVVTVNKRSAASTGGTSASPTVVPVDSSNAAAGGAVKTFTADPTEGALVGAVGVFKIATDGSLVWRPGDDQDGQRAILRTTAEAFTFESDTAVTWRGHVVLAEG